MSKTLNIEILAGVAEFPDDRARGNRGRAAMRDEKVRNVTIEAVAYEVAHDMDVAGRFDQVLLADDLKAVFAWLGARAGQAVGLKAWFAAHPRATLLAGVLAGSLGIMFGYVAILAAFFS